ncbi:NADP-dependent oxidoreductase [Nonomuraea sp. FMUSA5-5]|uniref:NADP-dependent oxidoreductase n=1 Tax=Nonomuraea composti TaxID=2720023 RepID=A0ABX1BM91_9ACTN|nr:NADP-dependent oxidoreductase [Nonomuraea sp. FMUSA5-5]NJP97422.1 NADP-dependent oxidoreductase [Nonomuraea sp. FMUSA5-5]
MTTTTTKNREIRLAARPDGLPGLDSFQLAETAVPDVGPGQVLIRNLYMSVDPGMLMLIGAYPGLPMPAYEVGAPLYGDAVGEVVLSRDPSVREGATVVHRLGWREYALAEAGEVRQVDPDAYPSPSFHLGFGLVAYAGLTAVAGLRTGETVFVSSAAGATGGMAGQIARLLGAGRVVGSAGSPEKVARLTGVLGFDAAFDHHDAPLAERLREAAPGGVDVYFDNVGGEQLRAALEVMNVHGRVALCGALSRQSAGGSPDAGPVGDPLALIGKRITLRGFRVSDHFDLAPEFGRRLRAWLADGSIVYDETVLDGLDSAPAALLGLIRGAYTGKVVVRLAR